MNFRHLIYITLIIILNNELTGQKKISPQEYIDNYKTIAIEEMKKSGIPASIKLAQGMLESDNGNSTLARKANNHFGIKCHKSWNGKTFYQDDDKEDECFRKYSDPEESFKDHTRFIITGDRYRFLFDYKTTDYKRWAKGLKKAGYATNPRYPELLIGIIERYNLSHFDHGYEAIKSNEKKTKRNNKEYEEITISKQRQVFLNNGVRYVLANENETLKDITKEFNLMRWELARYNDIDPDNLLSENQIVYLQPKKRKAAKGNEIHIMKENESMLYISQKYAVKLKKLYKYNRIEKGDSLFINDSIYLRNKKPNTR